ncbi:MAG: fatty acid desaturase [Planctomycetaceae bacterium]
MRPTPAIRERLVHWQQNRSPRAMLHGSLTFLQAALWGAAIWAWQQEHHVLLGAIWLTSIIVAHNKLIAFHEAAHGLLQPIRWLNELIGQILGCITLVPLTAYRMVHAQHHAYVGTVRDVEFWPFVDPTVSRPRRVFAVLAELLCAYAYDPLIFLRGVYVLRDVPAAQRRRAWREYAVCCCAWCTLAVVLTWRGWWPEFCVAFLIPSYIAAGINAVRRMVEHLGLLGDTIETKTRTIIPGGVADQALSAAALRVNYHTLHHRYARVPYYYLAEATRLVYAENFNRMPVFPSYWRALLDTLPHLANPRIGAQWLTNGSPPAQQSTSTSPTSVDASSSDLHNGRR